jgi:hypothetical protein
MTTPKASGCKCDLRTSLVGDGCEVCNPEMAAQLSHTIELIERDHEARVARLVEALEYYAAEDDQVCCDNGKRARAALDEWRKP